MIAIMLGIIIFCVFMYLIGTGFGIIGVIFYSAYKLIEKFFDKLFGVK